MQFHSFSFHWSSFLTSTNQRASEILIRSVEIIVQMVMNVHWWRAREKKVTQYFRFLFHSWISLLCITQPIPRDKGSWERSFVYDIHTRWVNPNRRINSYTFEINTIHAVYKYRSLTITPISLVNSGSHPRFEFTRLINWTGWFIIR